MELTVVTKKPVTVVTVRGTKISRDRAKLINGKYYERDIDVFHVENEKGVKNWYRTESGKISFNFETNQWDLTSRLEKNSNLVKGIADNTNRVGFFNRNLFNNVLLLERYSDSPFEALYCINKELAEKLGYIECIFNDLWYKKTNLTTGELKQILTKQKINYTDRGLDYNANNENKTYLQTLKAYHKNKHLIEIEDTTKEMEEFLDRYSFGVEFESSTGTVPVKYLDGLGILPVKDGSIAGYEYTTVPLDGVLGLQTLKLTCQELSKRCNVDHKCSMHIHIGNIRRDKEYILAMWMLIFNIQEELLAMFPEYKKDQVKYLGSKKNYCEFLPDLLLEDNGLYACKENTELKQTEMYEKKLKLAFGRIFEFLSGGYKEDQHYNFENFKHPQDENGKQKWNRTSRYRTVNFIPTVFDKSKTIEFRLHTPTFNHTKVSNWLFICIAIIRFCEIHQQEIIAETIDVSLKDIINGYKNNFGRYSESPKGKKIAKYLNAYIEHRKETFSKAWKENGDALCKSELTKDNSFTFEHNGILNLY